ncbi:MAG TPA: hypothetical protein IAB37_08465 [Candidatus Faecivivens stercoravium]|uniref:Uncharacterized protein n=1 Tax=Candidatus Faecivivens stercoravium TaxID=2840803 RepID=A0A9D1DYL0_9FIRM|nr:hypothetical protein [Candidatus Faecivivens stercoravium]
MYFKENEYDQMISRGRSDERVVGKVNLWTGALALILLIGAVAVILLLSIGEGWWALGAGVLTAALFVLAVWDPARVLKKRTRPESRLDVKSRE